MSLICILNFYYKLIEQGVWRIVRGAYFLTVNPRFIKLCYLLSWIYMGLAFFEPSFQGDNGYYSDWRYRLLPGVKVFESIILFTFWVEIILCFIHKFHDDSKPLKKKILKNKKLFANLIITILYTVDAIVFYVHLPTMVLYRFSRPFRPSNSRSLYVNM